MAADGGLDLISVGRSDLASSLGHPGQAGHPEVVEATHRLLREVAEHPARTCRSAMVIYDPSEAQTWLPDGCTVFIAPSESGLLMQASAHWAGAARGDQPL
jgi:4-hydroxy-2-oxoheptanedioate aldolase